MMFFISRDNNYLFVFNFALRKRSAIYLRSYIFTIGKKVLFAMKLLSVSEIPAVGPLLTKKALSSVINNF